MEENKLSMATKLESSVILSVHSRRWKHIPDSISSLAQVHTDSGIEIVRSQLNSFKSFMLRYTKWICRVIYFSISRLLLRQGEFGKDNTTYVIRDIFFLPYLALSEHLWVNSSLEVNRDGYGNCLTKDTRFSTAQVTHRQPVGTQKNN